jgi:hypothetical protein
MEAAVSAGIPITEENLRVGIQQPLDVEFGGVQVRLVATPAQIAEIRVRRHPNGAHVHAILAIAAEACGHRIAFFVSLTPAELRALGDRAEQAADHVLQHNGAVGYDWPFGGDG